LEWIDSKSSAATSLWLRSANDSGIDFADIVHMSDAQENSGPRKSSRDVTKSIPKKKWGKWGWMGAVVVVGLVTAAFVFWWEAQRTPDGADGAESTFPLETFVVNLGGSGQRAYLRAGITLGLAHPLTRVQREEMPTALVRDTILSILAEAQPEALLGQEGKRQLKEQVLQALQTRLPQIGVKNVYFTEFLVQM
jgi:flagellar basal body-associated protein FliL